MTILLQKITGWKAWNAVHRAFYCRSDFSKIIWFPTIYHSTWTLPYLLGDIKQNMSWKAHLLYSLFAGRRLSHSHLRRGEECHIVSPATGFERNTATRWDQNGAWANNTAQITRTWRDSKQQQVNIWWLVFQHGLRRAVYQVVMLCWVLGFWRV